MGLFKRFTNKFTAPEASVQLKLASYAISLGQTLQGSLHVSSREDFDATEVRCEILCTEQTKVLKQVYDPALKTSIPKIVEESVIIYNVKPSLSVATHFANGENRFFPVNVNIPAGATPTTSSLDRRVTWSIKGVVAVDGDQTGRAKLTKSKSLLQQRSLLWYKEKLSVLWL